MEKTELLDYLLEHLLTEAGQPIDIARRYNNADKRRLLRGLMNVRPARPIGEDFLRLQDEWLAGVNRNHVHINELAPIAGNFYLWQGDITRLACDAIINAANSAMLGCFIPCHACIDNAIHSAAGIQLRLECAALMRGGELPVGKARMTHAWNLPSRYIIHTVGPNVGEELTAAHCEQLADCYKACLQLAVEHRLASLAFCCISTGVFGFPNEKAAEIAVNTIKSFQEQAACNIKIVFNVFKDEDFAIYRKLLSSS